MSTIDKPRARKAAANVLGTALQVRYRHFLATSDDMDANARATAELAQAMYENIEFIIWALGTVGGRQMPPPEALRPITPRPAANDMPAFARPPVPVLAPEPVALECVCPPLEPGIIGSKHMTSCPLYKP